jgi:dienelactone hydrolase
VKANIAEIAQSFARDGFVVVPNLFRRAEVKVFKEGIQKILDEVRQEDGGEGSRQEMLDATGVYSRSCGAQRPVPPSSAR